MFGRRRINLGRGAFNRSAGRRAVVPPELLEPRNAPGACLYLSWLMEPTASELADSSFIDAESLAASEWEEAGSGQSNLATSYGDQEPAVSPTYLDNLWLLDNNGAATDADAFDHSMIQEAQYSVRRGPMESPLACNLHSVADTKLSAELPSVTGAESKRDVPPAEPIIAMTPPPDATPAPTGGNSGGGGSKGSGGGGTSGGGGSAVHAHQSASASVAAATPASAASAPKVTAAAQTAPAISAPVVTAATSTTTAATAAPLVAPVTLVAEPAAIPVNTPAPPTFVSPIAPAGNNSSPPAAPTAPLEPSIPAQSIPATVAVVPPTLSPTNTAASTSASQIQSLSGPIVLANGPIITAAEVQILLDRAAAATSRNDAIIAVVDRGGRILGVRVEGGVPIADPNTLVFAIDGAVAKARTAAFFSNDQAPLTSRTVRFISQSTITQREVESNPNETDPTVQGPGFVGPIGLGGHFPPDVPFTPHVDLFAIEHTNRDSVIHPGENGVREDGMGDDVDLMTRFGADFAMGVDIPAPESYGFVSGQLEAAQSRGIATLPGGIPLFKIDPADNKQKLVGGIGVFFPGPDGFATFEQNFQHADARSAAGLAPQTTNERLNAPLVKQAEYMAFAAAGGVGAIAGIAAPAGYVLPMGRIDLAGITLEIYGPHPNGAAGLVEFGRNLGEGSLIGGIDMPVTTGGDLQIDGESLPDGWLVEPQAGTNLTADEVRDIIEAGIAEAGRVRAAIRLPLGSSTRMVLSVTDTNGEILGLFRMPDATFFSIDVAVAKARNVAYYADPAALQPEDQVDDNNDGVADVPAGTAFTNRSFRYLASPFFPTGFDTTRAGDFSILNDPGINTETAENTGAPRPFTDYTSVLGYDAFNPGTNFREPNDPNAVVGNQNGVVFFPGSTPLYKNGELVGGLGVSGDGVDQDDVVTFGAGGQFLPRPESPILRADETFVRGIRLPYQKFSRNARA